MCDGDEAVLGFRDFLGRVYLVVILVCVREISEDVGLGSLWENAR